MENPKAYINHGEVMRTIVLALLIFSAGAAQALEKRPPFHPIKMLCSAAGEDAKPFQTVDFEVRQVSKELGQVGEMLPSTYSPQTYPFPDYRPISTGKEKFRIAAQVMSTPYKLDQYIAYLTIYEEDPDGKTLRKRAAHVIDAADLKTTYQVQYKIPNSKRGINCFANSPDLSKAFVQEGQQKSRVPAKKAK